jgi:hypothetical protein
LVGESPCRDALLIGLINYFVILVVLILLIVIVFVLLKVIVVVLEFVAVLLVVELVFGLLVVVKVILVQFVVVWFRFLLVGLFCPRLFYAGRRPALRVIPPGACGR